MDVVGPDRDRPGSGDDLPLYQSKDEGSRNRENGHRDAAAYRLVSPPIDEPVDRVLAIPHRRQLINATCASATSASALP